MTRRSRDGAPAARLAAVFGLIAAACLTRPVKTSDPNFTTTFTTTVNKVSIDKVDLLFMIDNSASMGDKQALLAQAVPDMITRLVQPNCVDDVSGAVRGRSDLNGACPAQTRPEFPPVHDMHIGIVTSSLGDRGTNRECSAGASNSANPSLGAHADDRGELINRGGRDEHNVANANPSNFLAWFPQTAANVGLNRPAHAETSVGAAGQPGTLVGDFTDMIIGVHEHGCGFEAQNEAWYRFLVQPDPFDKVTLDATGRATLSGVDATILAQRAAFLRPDSLLAIIVVTDENEEISNPLAVSGYGSLFMEPWPSGGDTTVGAPEGTSECRGPTGPASGPNDPNCDWCGYSNVQNFAQRCPIDPPGDRPGFLSAQDDAINVRFFNQKARFGVFAGYPISRYTRGLMNATVPSRDHEVDRGGNYVGDQDQYANCINPIYAKKLPSTVPADPKALCALTPGPRTPDLVFYAAIAGVPHELLQVDPQNPDSPQKAVLSESDWNQITGADPAHYDFTGASPYMLESEDPRPTPPGCGPDSSDACDPVNGREWKTGAQDLQFACTFELVDPMTGMPAPKDCTNPDFFQACDCYSPPLQGAPFDQANVNPYGKPLCKKDAAGKYMPTQTYGKAYPSVREMAIARTMAHSPDNHVQGVVSSLCPIHTRFANGDTSDPLYGYRPAVSAIIERLKVILEGQCLPEQLAVDPIGAVPCLLLATMPCATTNEGGDTCIDSETAVCSKADQGLSVPAPDILALFRRQMHASWLQLPPAGRTSPDPSTAPVCQMVQIKNSDPAYQACLGSENATPAGWCYASGQGAKGCPQEILFTQNAPPHGAQVSLECFEQTHGVVGQD